MNYDSGNLNSDPNNNNSIDSEDYGQFVGQKEEKKTFDQVEAQRPSDPLDTTCTDMSTFKEIIINDPEWQKEGITDLLGHQAYDCVAIQQDGTSNPVKKRYTNIAQLYQRLIEEEPATIVPPIPPKDFQTYISKEKALKERTQGIRNFFETLRNHPRLSDSKHLIAFFNPSMSNEIQQKEFSVQFLEEDWPIDEVESPSKQSNISYAYSKLSTMINGSTEDERKKMFGQEAGRAQDEFNKFEKEEKVLEEVKSVFINLRESFIKLADCSKESHTNSNSVADTLKQYKEINENPHNDETDSEKAIDKAVSAFFDQAHEQEKMKIYFEDDCEQKLSRVLAEIESVKQTSLRRKKIAARYFQLVNARMPEQEKEKTWLNSYRSQQNTIFKQEYERFMNEKKSELDNFMKLYREKLDQSRHSDKQIWKKYLSKQ